MSWYLARNGEQKGPFDLPKLIAAAQAGKLQADDLVWTEGMPEWLPANRVPELNPNAAARPVGTATVQPAAAPEMQYYSNRGSMPERAAQNLRGWAAPLGDTGQWPLSDAELAQWTEAYRHRKVIRSAYSLFRGLCALEVIAAVIIGIAMLFALAENRRGGTWAMAIGFLMAMTVITAFAVVFGLAASATRKNQVWGAITSASLIGLGMLLNVVSVMLNILSGGSRDVVPIVITAIISLAIGGAMLAVSLRAIPAIKRFRACPAWCQELMAVAKF